MCAFASITSFTGLLCGKTPLSITAFTSRKDRVEPSILFELCVNRIPKVLKFF